MSGDTSRSPFSVHLPVMARGADARRDGHSEAVERFVLLLGNVRPGSATSRLKVSGIRYEQKRLQSGAKNWNVIRAMLDDPDLICVVGQLNAAVFDLIAAPEYSDVAPRLLESIGKVPHSLFVHESVLAGEQTRGRDYSREEDDGEPDETFIDYLHSSGWFRSPDEDVRSAVARFFERFELRVVPYTTNAEFEVMAEEFVNDNERDLLFRVYVPAGKLYAAEAEKLLSLFREWLGRVERQGVRQDGYETPSGHMYEFFGDGRPRTRDLSADFLDFSDFLELCVDDPSEAERRLQAKGLELAVSSEIVVRYGREARRIELDLKQERERRIVGIRHGLEVEMLEQELSDSQQTAIEALVDSLVPSSAAGVGALVAVSSREPPPGVVNVQVNQQFIEHVKDSVVQNVQGTAHLGPDPKLLLGLIAAHGGAQASELASAVHELEDPDAGRAARVKARQLLKGFTIRLGGVVQDTVLKAMSSYLETKLGI